ncbi:MAG TPA: hypothetical protein VMT12_15715 [Syntrophales bacterium]|nr:hypothetical protein [Syntrophales bacterium]
MRYVQLTMKICYKCKKEVKVDKIIGRKDTCPSCQTDLRCCLNCRFYDLNAYNNCREPQADRVLDKDRSNFCDYFNFKDSASEEKSKQSNDPIRKKLDDLFK